MADEMAIQRIRSMLEPSALTGPNEIELQGPARTAESPEAQGPSFADTLKESIAEVNGLQLQADAAIQELAVGNSTDVQGTIMAIGRADVSFKLMMEVRNKIISAYQEVMRTQV